MSPRKLVRASDRAEGTPERLPARFIGGTHGEARPADSYVALVAPALICGRLLARGGGHLRRRLFVADPGLPGSRLRGLLRRGGTGPHPRPRPPATPHLCL